MLTYELRTAPLGAIVDPSSGAVNWTPSATQTGLQTFLVRVTDDGGLFSEQPFTVNVTDVNQPPTITSVPILLASQTVAYSYTVTADDPDPTDNVTFQLVVSPPGASINSLSGEIQWTPDETQEGQHDFRVRAGDAGGLSDEQLFIVVVAPESNVAPEFTSTPPPSASMNVAFTYSAVASDANRDDEITYSLEAGPGSATVDSVTGQITWMPSGIGMHSFIVRATDDGDGNLFSEQSFSVDVRYRINCGEQGNIYIDPDGNAWARDFGYDNPASERYSVTDMIAGTDSDPLYRSERYTLANARLGYSLPTLPRTVTVILHFAETTYNAAGVRVFDIEIEGVTLYSGYDILSPSAAGAPLTATSESFEITVADNSLDIVLVDRPQDAPKISAIEVIGHETLQVAPIITSTPPMTAMESQLFTYDVDAIDGNPGDTITYSIAAGPLGATIDANTGVLEWTPTMDDVGMNNFTVQATDSTLMATLQTFGLQILSDTNLPPVFSSVPPSVGSVNVELDYTAVATDANPGTSILYTLNQAPDDATIDTMTGRILWTPGGLDMGSHTFVVQASDQHPMGALTVTQTFTVDVGYRINCGETSTVFVDPFGLSWALDFGFDANSSVYDQAVSIAGTAKPTLYHSERYSFEPQMSYTLPVPSGSYKVQLHFSENHWTASEQRLFDIFVGSVDLLGFDIYDLVGRRRAHIEEFSVSVTGGSLQVVLALIDDADAPKLCAIEILRDGDANTAPTIDSPAATSATALMPYNYDVLASDADDDPLTFSLLAAPVGASIGTSNGQISWTPGADDVGAHSFSVEVRDSMGATALQNFDVVVAGIPNDPPTIGSAAPTSATVNVQLAYDVNASDSDGDDLFFSLVSAPAGAAIDDTTGLLTWTPTGMDLGVQTITLRVTDDGFGELSVEQTLTLDVRYRINCGELSQVYTDSNGDTWAIDFGFDAASSQDFTLNVGIQDTVDDTIYQSERYTLGAGTSYSLTVPGNGTYAVRLHFAETFWSSGERIFDVSLEGSAALTNYDIASSAGANFKATFENFTVAVIGNLDLSLLKGLQDAPKISAIEVYVP